MVPVWLLTAGNFVKANWKVFAAIGLVLAAFFWYKGQMRQAYKNGKADCNAEWVKKIDAENKKNREFEKELQKDLSGLGQKIDETNAARVIRENTHKETIREIIKDNPIYTECKVEPKILDERNKIRALGPK